ncbi:hypothetical protein ETB97_008482 [Aspergillus alliaceus]|uniref:DJ-1/PfpI domain-containing protein n=1 Tax=Petromyces alliaceus TaxID=209559 RepID=A0A8H6E150_PETAA|nr:hypothetical protein ETB97_008482 [Aspergillus burnettii]
MFAGATSPPLRIGYLLFPGFQALDVFGPLDALNILSWTHEIVLHLVASSRWPVSTKPDSYPNAFEQRVLPTDTFTSVPPLDVLFVPGGLGTRSQNVDIEEAIQFIHDVFPRLKYLVTVCTGATLAAQAGVLNGKRATTNKKAWKMVTEKSPLVEWVPQARWVVDGKVWTSAGVSAGIDTTLAWIEEVWGPQVAKQIADGMEYVRETESTLDPFCALNGLAAP